LALIAACVLIPFAALSSLHARCVRAVVNRERVVHHPLALPFARNVVPLSFIASRRITRWGLALSLDRKAPLLLQQQALCLPTQSAQELQAAVAVLDAGDLLRGEPAAEAYHPALWPRLGSLLLTFLAAALPLFVTIFVGKEVLEFPRSHLLIAVGVAALVFVPLALVVYQAHLAQLRTLHMGPDSVALDHLVFPYPELIAVHVVEGGLVLETPTRRAAAWIRAPRAEVEAFLTRRLANVGGPPVSSSPPAWARARLSPRRAARIRAPYLVAWPLFFLALWAAPNHEVLQSGVSPARDLAQLVVEFPTKRPLLLLTSEGPAQRASFTLPGLWSETLGKRNAVNRVDLVARRLHLGDAPPVPIPTGTTWIHLTPAGPRFRSPVLAGTPELRSQAEGMRWAREALAALAATLASLNSPAQEPRPLPPILRYARYCPGPAAWAEDLLETDDPELRAWLRGETSRRLVFAQGADGHALVWLVDRGRVAFVADVHPSAKAHVGESLRFLGIGASASAPTQGGPWARTLRLAADGAVAASVAGVPRASALWTATERVRAGATVRAALARVLPSLYATGGSSTEPANPRTSAGR
jgi:hypothetical protein